MSRKRIETFSKAEFNQKLVYFDLYGGDQFGYGRIVYEEASEGDLDFYILQNSEDGVPCDVTDPNFKYSFYYDPADIQLYTLTEEEEKTFTERIRLLETLDKNDSVFWKGSIKKISKKDQSGLWIGSERLSITDVFMQISNPDTFYSDMYSKLLKNPYIMDSYRRDIESVLKGKNPYTGNVLMDVNGVCYHFKIDSNLDISYYGIQTSSKLFKMDRFENASVKQHVQDFDIFWKSFMSSFEKRTYLSNQVSSIIRNLNCDETIKNKLIEGDFYNNMQFIDYDEETKMISFLPKGKTLVYDGEKLTQKNRQTQKPHKFFNTILKGTASEYDIKCFADEMIAFFNSWAVKYYKGKKLAENYSTVNTRDWQTKSCMDRKAENFFDLYTQPVFRLGVIYRAGEIVGRFIEVTTDEKFVYNDRLYYKDETVLAWYNSWVDKNKMNRKYKNDFSSKQNFYNVEKGQFSKKVTISLKKQLDTFNIYPYLDTLSFGFKNKIQNFDSEDVRYEFQDQYGKCKRTRCQLDVITNAYIDQHLAIHIDFGAKAGQYTTVQNLIYSKDNGGHCLK